MVELFPFGGSGSASLLDFKALDGPNECKLEFEQGGLVGFEAAVVLNERQGAAEEFAEDRRGLARIALGSHMLSLGNRCECLLLHQNNLGDLLTASKIVQLTYCYRQYFDAFGTTSYNKLPASSGLATAAAHWVSPVDLWFLLGAGLAKSRH
jgi:hypothetical protein